MSEYQYTIILHPDTEEGGYTVTVPALPGCVTQGETLADASIINTTPVSASRLILEVKSDVYRYMGRVRNPVR